LEQPANDIPLETPNLDSLQQVDDAAEKLKEATKRRRMFETTYVGDETMDQIDSLDILNSVFDKTVTYPVVVDTNKVVL